VKELAGRLAALDPEAVAAVRVIAYFDQLGDAGADLEAVVRGAAVLAGCPARLVDEGRRVQVRVRPDGRREDRDGPCDPAWPHAHLSPDGVTGLWLERADADGPVVAMVLERGAATARAALERTRGRAPAGPVDDPAMVELVLDASAPERARLHAARTLRLPATARAVALGDPAEARVSGVDGVGTGGRRAGIGPPVALAELPSSWAAARIALRFAAEGTERDPGPREVYAETLGGLAVLAATVRPGTPPVADVTALEHAGGAAPWMLGTLHAVAYALSLRTAATDLAVHHPALQDRLTHAEHLLGWTVRDPAGRLRLQLAFALRRLHRNA
jgi:PucR C-terminal helix-turn-helix domain